MASSSRHRPGTRRRPMSATPTSCERTRWRGARNCPMRSSSTMAAHATPATGATRVALSSPRDTGPSSTWPLDGRRVRRHAGRHGRPRRATWCAPDSVVGRANELTQCGIMVLLDSRHPDQGAAAARDWPPSDIDVTPVQLDVTDAASVEAVAAQLRREHRLQRRRRTTAGLRRLQEGPPRPTSTTGCPFGRRRGTHHGGPRHPARRRSNRRPPQRPRSRPLVSRAGGSWQQGAHPVPTDASVEGCDGPLPATPRLVRGSLAVARILASSSGPRPSSRSPRLLVRGPPRRLLGARLRSRGSAWLRGRARATGPSRTKGAHLCPRCVEQR